MNNDKKIVLHPVTNEENNSFVGIRIRNDEIHFHYPESYELGNVFKFCTLKNGLYCFEMKDISSSTLKRNFRNDIVNIQQVYNAFIMPYNKHHNMFGYQEDLEYCIWKLTERGYG